MSEPSTIVGRIKQAIPAFHYALIFIAFATATLRFFFLEANDRYKCHALLNDGEWLDAGLSSPSTLQNWQPDGCMLHSYNEKTSKTCLADKTLYFIGDSVVRQLYYSTAKILDSSIEIPDYYSNNDVTAIGGEKKHQDVDIAAGGASLKFIWDPYLNASKTLDILDRRLTADGGTIPALVVLGTGLWQLRYLEAAHAGQGMEAYTASIDRVFSATQPQHSQIADEVVLLPVQPTILEKLSAERASSLPLPKIGEMNDILHTKLPPFSSSLISQLSIPYVFNDMISAYPSSLVAQHTPDGLHLDASLRKTQANILLNLRCNDVLPKKFTFDKTCCNQYPTPNWLQALLLLVILVWAPLGTHFYASRNAKDGILRFFPPQHVLYPLTIFGFSSIFLYFADRTSLFLKIQKQFDFWQFTIAMVLALVLGVCTMKKPEKGDLGFLNRDQTDEWKGWMQIAILIYHYYGASKISGIYNPIRVLVAAYLFMSGYGHFFFYYKKGDYGLSRIAQVLIRLNLLTLVLAYIQDTDYLSYYFSPLTTLWFGVIWVTMYIGNSYNKQSSLFMVGKIILSSMFVTAFHHLGWPLVTLFNIYNTLFNTAWNAREWTFRVTLDMYIVYIGMLAAFLFIKFQEHKIAEKPYWEKLKRNSIILSVITMMGWFYFELQYNKLDYNRFHPYTSMLPIFAFIILRNATPYLRSTSSKAYIWIGQCSLETFICQFHLWLAGDTKGLLVLLPFPRWRFLNMVFTTLIFLFISNQIAVTTGDLTDWICGKKPKAVSGSGGAKRAPAAAGGAGEGTTNGGAEYLPLTQVDTVKAEQEGNAPAAHARTPSLASLGAGAPSPLAVNEPSLLDKLSSAMTSLPGRCVFVMGLIWIINILYPNVHPMHGHLLPTH